MLFFFIGIAATTLGLIAAVFSKQAKVQGFIALLVGVVLIAISFFTSVPTGYTCILTTFGKVNDNTLEAGINIKAPWQDVVLMDNREQKTPFETLAFSADMQEVKVSGTVSHTIDRNAAMKLYRDVGKKYYDTLVTPRLNESTKVTISAYTAEQLIAHRSTVTSTILNMVNDATSEYGLKVVNLSIDIDFADSFTDAVEAKQVATQVFQKAQTEQEQETMIAQQRAEREKIEAQAKADVAKLQADAEAYAIQAKASAEAEANAKIAASLTNELIDYQRNAQWNGALPTTYIGGDTNSIPIINP